MPYHHFVVLKSWTKNGAEILDPALGERQYNHEDFSKHFTGIILELQPTKSFEKRKEKINFKISDMWSGITGLRRNLIQIFMLATIMQIFILASPFYMQITIDEVLTKYDIDLLFVLALGFAGFTLLNVIAQTLRGYVLLYLGSMLSFQMVNNLFRHLVRLPMPYFEKRHIGDIMSRFGSNEPIRTFLTDGIVAVLLDGILAITTLILMYVYSPLLATIAVVSWLIYLIMRLALYKPFRRAQEDVIVSQAKESSTFIETLSGMTTIKLFAAENDRQSLWQNKFAEVISLSAKLQRLQIWFGTASTFLMGIEHVILVFVAAKMVLQAQFTIGMIFAFMSYRRSFSQNAVALVERIIEFRLLNLHLERIFDIALEPQEDQGENEFSAPQEIKGNIEFRNITFSYAPSEALVLDKINFSITAGETVAIVGKSGCGKTTLLKLATGLFKVNQGDILIDGKELNEFGIANFRRQIGVVIQEDKLFSGSLTDNIGFFDPEINMDLVVKSAKQAMIHDEIMQMPMKYESLIGDMGTALSGGQIQRVILARALYRKPKILFMDEGTAHLDIPTERAVIKSVAALGITRIIIAHRPETINSADRILSFENGKLTEKAKQETSEKRIEIAEDKTQTSSLNNCRKPAVNFTTDNLQASQPIKSGGHSNRLEKYTLFQSNSNLKKE